MSYKHLGRGGCQLLHSDEELDGKVLGCFGKPLVCHGDILVEVLNELKSKGEQL